MPRLRNVVERTGASLPADPNGHGRQLCAPSVHANRVVRFNNAGPVVPRLPHVAHPRRRTLHRNLVYNVIAPPRSFRVMGQRFRVEIVPPGEGMNMEDASALGTTFHHESKVRIRAAGAGGLSEIQQIDTYLHEALHAIVHVAALHQTLHLDHADEEGMVATLTPQILLLLRDNPSVVTYLTQRLT